MVVSAETIVHLYTLSEHLYNIFLESEPRLAVREQYSHLKHINYSPLVDLSHINTNDVNYLNLATLQTSDSYNTNYFQTYRSLNYH